VISPLYPFPAVIGQEDLKKALILCAINPLIGGVLIRGEKGTAKSTAARGLSELLPEIVTVKGCPNGCDPMGPLCPQCLARLKELALDNSGSSLATINNSPSLESVKRRAPFLTLPLSATEDRVAGGLDLSEALASGRRRVTPGLLAQAHRGILYIDEVNLLDDHIVDLVLDAAASGVNRLEREGLSLSHPANFLLVGTMNPEEGELRPQFLDRFGLSVAITSEDNVDLRVELMLRREAFDASPISFRKLYQKEVDSLKERLYKASRFLPKVKVPSSVRRFASQLASEHNTAGHRADLTLERAALALAAWKGLEAVGEAEVIEVSPMVLAHRQREAVPPPPPPPPAPEEPEEPEEPEKQEDPKDPEKPQDQENQDNQEDQKDPENQKDQKESQPEDLNQPPEPQDPNQNPPEPGEAPETVFEIGSTFRVVPIRSPFDRIRRRGSGRRSRSRVSQKQGRYVKSGPDQGRGDLAVDATIRAAAPYQLSREKPPGLALVVQPSDFREAVREKKMGNYLFFTVDASGSMGARGRMAASKGAIMSLLLDAYQKRDQVALISFRRDQAQVNLPLTASIDLAGKLLSELPVGGRTPLSSGLALTYREVRNSLSKNPLARPIVIIITDGRGNVSLAPEAKPFEEALKLAKAMTWEKRVKYIVVDTEETGAVTFGLARRLAESLSAVYFKTETLESKTLVDLVKNDELF
jgi:magnesium chelatase subunit D